MAKNNRKTIFIISACVVLLLAAIICIPFLFNQEKKTTIITSNFISYDLSRAVLGDETDLKLLIEPGSDIHSFEPTPQDIIDISHANLIIYNGGESEAWLTELIANNEIDESKTLRLMDYVELQKEASPDTESNSGEVEYDEHIWTSPKNAIALVSAVKDKLSSVHPENQPAYEDNANAYIEKLNLVDQNFRDIVENSTKKELIFADRFPFLYFVKEYGLDYYAAFPGCAEQTEASSNVIASLVDKIRSDDIHTILKIELSDSRLADTIASETGANILELHSAHNISKEDFGVGLTYAEIMDHNLDVVKEALK